MRDILFRGKAVNLNNGSKDFVFGQYVQNRDGKFIYSDTWENGKQKHQVIEKTVGQYTGLTDKNGKKIFEGDIVVCELFEEIGQISYHESEAMFVVEFDTWLTDFDHMYGHDLEVIGNIHDNPEWLKGGAE